MANVRTSINAVFTLVNSMAFSTPWVRAATESDRTPESAAWVVVVDTPLVVKVFGLR